MIMTMKTQLTVITTINLLDLNKNILLAGHHQNVLVNIPESKNHFPSSLRQFLISSKEVSH